MLIYSQNNYDKRKLSNRQIRRKKSEIITHNKQESEEQSNKVKKLNKNIQKRSQNTPFE